MPSLLAPLFAISHLTDHKQSLSQTSVLPNTNTYRYDILDSLFRNVFGLPWKVASYTKHNVYARREVKHVVTDDLPEAYYPKAVFLNNVATSDALYTPSHEPDPNDSDEENVREPPSQDKISVMAAVAKVGLGRVAFMGDVNAGGKNGVEIIAAMCEKAPPVWKINELG